MILNKKIKNYQSQQVDRGKRVGSEEWRGNQQSNLHLAHLQSGPGKHIKLCRMSFFLYEINNLSYCTFIVCFWSEIAAISSRAP